MTRFVASTGADVLNLMEWIAADPYHHEHITPHWWLTAQGYLSFRLDDAWGPVLYVRVDDEGEYFRLHVQFAPPDLVSRSRVVCAMLDAIPQMVEIARLKGKRGLITESVSPSLIAFLCKQGFKPTTNNDYVREIAEGREDEQAA
jgi:hypothetical protein